MGAAKTSDVLIVKKLKNIYSKHLSVQSIFGQTTPLRTHTDALLTKNPKPVVFMKYIFF